MLTKVIGIVSWFPAEEPMRGQRINRIKHLFEDIEREFPGTPIIVIAQDWNGFKPKINMNKVHLYEYGRLGILKARQTLREKFLELGFDYLIMFDDDAIISVPKQELIQEYFDLMDKNPQGFAFCKREAPNSKSGKNPYVDSQLNFCCVSRWIYEREPIPDIDAQQSEAYEDRVFSMLLHVKYADKEFDIPEGLKSVHFKNKEKPVPSTWARTKHLRWDRLGSNTLKLEDYILEHKDLPKNLKDFFKNDVK